MGLEICPLFPSLRSSSPSHSPQNSMNVPSSLPDSIVQSLSQTYHDSLYHVLNRFRHLNFVITDPCLPGHPIVFASDGFLVMSGYLAEEVFGRNPKFLQGPDTDRHTILGIRDAVREERACQFVILNYTKQGWPFWNMFHLSPLYSKVSGRVIHFVGVQTPLSCCVVASVRSLPDTPSFAINLLLGDRSGSSCACRGTRCALGVLNRRKSGADCFSCIKLEGVAGTDLGYKQKCEVLDFERQKTSSVMRSLIHELAQSSRMKGSEVSQRRYITHEALYSRETFISSSLMLALNRIRQSFVLSNPHFPGMHIIYASDMFLRLTGYSRNEVLGCNCKFLQGPGTDLNAVHQIQESIKMEKACTVRILNYRKDKTSFWNLLHVAPVRNNGGQAAFFVGVQMDVTSESITAYQRHGLTAHMQQLGAVGAVKVAVRTLQGPGLRRVLE